MSRAGAILAAWAAGEALDLPVLVVAAHPGDETIGLGGQIPRLRNLALLHVTDGAPRDGRDAAALGFGRRDVAQPHGIGRCTVAQVHGIGTQGAAQVHGIGRRDAAQVHGIGRRDAAPARGFGGRRDYAAARARELSAALRVAGQEAAWRGRLGVAEKAACAHLPDMARALAGVFRRRAPALVVTHAYEGGHPDHDATALAVHAAAARLRASGEAAPALAEMTGYHAAPAGGLRVGHFLPAEGVTEVVLPLSPAARERKARMLACFATQRAALARFPVGAEDRLRPAPPHDFGAPPHPGRLHYEDFPWGMTGALFRARARQLLSGALRSGSAACA